MNEHNPITKEPITSGLTETDQEYFHNVTTHAYESMNKGDRHPYIDRYASDAVYMAPHEEIIVGKESIHDFIMAYPDVRVEFPAEEMFGTANHVNIRGTFVMHDPEGNLLDRGKYLSVWQKSPKGKWNITHDIFNSDLPLPNTSEQ